MLEVNPNPDISDEAGFARSARTAGYSFPATIGKIVESALERWNSVELPEGAVIRPLRREDRLPLKTLLEADTEVFTGDEIGIALELIDTVLNTRARRLCDRRVRPPRAGRLLLHRSDTGNGRDV